VTGHNGLVGSAILRSLSHVPEIKLVTANRNILDLLNQDAVASFFFENKIDEIYMCAAKVGGIHANNTYPAEFIYENIMIAANVIHAAYLAKVDKLLFLGSSCIYPKETPQPISEDSLLSGFLEPTNEPYAIAKITGLKLCESYNRQYDCDFRCLMPTNLYGPHDNFHPKNSHVIPALIQRFHNEKVAGDKTVTVWGTGMPKREFLYVDDLADACIYIMGLSKLNYKNALLNQSFVNVGTGKDISLRELAQMIKEIVGFSGDIEYDKKKTDGTMLKRLDVSKISELGWSSKIPLSEGLQRTYDWFLNCNPRGL
jgi:GDP-L-fucose synthase